MNFFTLKLITNFNVKTGWIGWQAPPPLFVGKPDLQMLFQPPLSLQKSGMFVVGGP